MKTSIARGMIIAILLVGLKPVILQGKVDEPSDWSLGSIKALKISADWMSI